MHQLLRARPMPLLLITSLFWLFAGGQALLCERVLGKSWRHQMCIRLHRRTLRTCLQSVWKSLYSQHAILACWAHLHVGDFQKCTAYIICRSLTMCSMCSTPSYPILMDVNHTSFFWSVRAQVIISSTCWIVYRDFMVQTNIWGIKLLQESMTVHYGTLWNTVVPFEGMSTMVKSFGHGGIKNMCFWKSNQKKVLVFPLQIAITTLHFLKKKKVLCEIFCNLLQSLV